MRRGALIKRALFGAALVLLLVSLANLGLLDAARLEKGARNISLFLRDLFPPDLSVLPTVAWALVETVQMAFAGTMLGFAFALPLSLAATRVLLRPPVSTTFRLLLAFIRTVPSLLWAIVFVVAVGLGPGAGTLGIALYTTGYLGKVFYEAFEGVDHEILEAVRGVGCSRLQLARYAVLPESANLVLAQLLFLFEYNVRASAIMGFVGAGGIGFYLLGYIQALQYDRMLTALLLTLLVVIFIDWSSGRIRALVLSVPISNRKAKAERAT
jgi:phosphonate transport system permease protein